VLWLVAGWGQEADSGGEKVRRGWVGGAQAELGREVGGRRWGPRPLDLDIIFYDSLTLQEEGLQIPHPRWHERPFVQVRLSQSPVRMHIGQCGCQVQDCSMVTICVVTQRASRVGAL
jgi:hypothetical protein